MATFGSRLRQLRKQKNMTQKDLATAVGLSFSAISMYERGERQPDFETLETIARYFNVTPASIMGWSEDENGVASYIDENGNIVYVYPDSEKPPVRMDEGQDANVIRIAGRDGSYQERRLTDEQLDIIRRMVDQMPDFKD